MVLSSDVFGHVDDQDVVIGRRRYLLAGQRSILVASDVEITRVDRVRANPNIVGESVRFAHIAKGLTDGNYQALLTQVLICEVASPREVLVGSRHRVDKLEDQRDSMISAPLDGGCGGRRVAESVDDIGRDLGELAFDRPSLDMAENRVG